ncbi:LysR family transcriptional regulator [Celeribacter indicus]|uniref:LysR family transcriptional regulator n=3 Tax=Celeribacter indicus TaxID=1208324 RepID=A0A0B5E0J9_9RHOB|nr:LysR family transcriptional regulator [Celeribacter indicus]
MDHFFRYTAPMITLRQMTYFLALAETRSFSAAAERVHVTQPALSQQIKEMEATLGTQLVERLPRDIRLTRAGQVVLERTRTILAMTRDLEAEIRLSKGLRGRLALGVIPTIAPYLLPRALTRIRAAALDLDMRVREAQTAELISLVAHGHLDAAVIALPYDTEGLTARPLFRDRFLLAGSRDRIAAATTTPRPTDLSPDTLLLLEEGHCLADQALEVCGLRRQRRTVDLGASSLATLCGLVAQGFGLTLVPELALCTEMAASPDMAVTRFTAPEPSRTVALVRRQSTEVKEWFTALGDLLSEAGEELLAEARRRG